MSVRSRRMRSLRFSVRETVCSRPLRLTKTAVRANLQGPSALQVLARGCIPVLRPSHARRRPTCVMSLPLVGGAGDVAALLAQCTRFWQPLQHAR